LNLSTYGAGPAFKHESVILFTSDPFLRLPDAAQRYLARS
jgi:hypothetical protein